MARNVEVTRTTRGALSGDEAEELFAEAQKMAQLRYKTYIRKSQENWED